MNSRIDTLRKLYADTSRLELLEIIEQQQDLILRSADRELDSFVKPVFERLISWPSLSHLEPSEAWPYGRPLEKTNFLSHFFWAKYETYYRLSWDSAFEEVIRKECIRAIGQPESWSDFQIDLFVDACGIEEVSVTFPTSVTDWAARSLYLKVYNILLDGDMDTIAGWGVDDDDDE